MNSFRKYLLISLILGLVNAVILLVFFVPRLSHTDTVSYLSTIKYILGEPGGEVALHRILNPLPILIGASLSPLADGENALILQNVIFYVLSVLLIFFLVYEIYHNEKQAFYGTVLFMTAFPVLAYGLAALTDMSGWFFFLLTVLLSLNFLKNPSFRTAILPGLVASFGMLFKENVAAAPIFFASLVFIAANLSFKEKIKYLIVFGLAFLFFPLINSLILNHFFSYYYLTTFQDIGAGGKAVEGFYMYTFPRILIEIGRAFLIGWIFILLGVFREFSIKNKERIKILLAFIPPSLSVFLWICPHNRMFFIAFPILVLLGSFGLLRTCKNTKIGLLAEAVFLIIYVVINYAILEFLLKYGIYFWRFGDLSY